MSDAPNGAAAQAWGVYNAERKLATRSYFIVDKDGVVRYKKVLKPGEPLVPNETLLEELKKINSKT